MLSFVVTILETFSHPISCLLCTFIRSHENNTVNSLSPVHLNQGRVSFKLTNKFVHSHNNKIHKPHIHKVIRMSWYDSYAIKTAHHRYTGVANAPILISCHDGAWKTTSYLSIIRISSRTIFPSTSLIVEYRQISYSAPYMILPSSLIL